MVQEIIWNGEVDGIKVRVFRFDSDNPNGFYSEQLTCGCWQTCNDRMALKVYKEALFSYVGSESKPKPKEIKVQFFNSYGNTKVFEMMKSDGIVPNEYTKVTLERLHGLSKSYDVTIRTTTKSYDVTMQPIDSWVGVFLALPTPFLPGPSDEA